jgi:hypothetical protein
MHLAGRSLLGSYQQSKLKRANLYKALKETRKLLSYEKNFSTMRSKSPREGSRETARRACCQFGAWPAKTPCIFRNFSRQERIKKRRGGVGSALHS